MFLRPVFDVDSPWEAVDSSKIDGKKLDPKKPVFGQSEVYSKYSLRHSFYPIGLIFGYYMGDSKTYQSPEVQVHSFFICAP